MSETFLVTGALGCLGAWTVRRLVEQGASVIAFDSGTSTARADLVLERPLTQAATLVVGDIADPATVLSAVRDHGVNRVIHLAALQVPACAADPALGARVNVVGTVNIFQAIAQSEGLVPGVAYASSFAVYGDPSVAVVRDDTPSTPRTHYGVYKAANEASARVFWDTASVRSVGIRPYVVYGVGRDQGLTAGPSLGMLAAVAGQSHRIGYGGTATYQFAADVADCLVSAARAAPQSATVVTLDGVAADMPSLLSLIEAAEPGARGHLTHANTELPFPPGVQADAAERLFAEVQRTPLAAGIEQTLAHFRRNVSAAGFTAVAERLRTGS